MFSRNSKAQQFVSLLVSSDVINNEKYSSGLLGSSKSTLQPGLSLNGKHSHSASMFVYVGQFSNVYLLGEWNNTVLTLSNLRQNNASLLKPIFITDQGTVCVCMRAHQYTQFIPVFFTSTLQMEG
jgi:hypothetical protein